MNLTAKKALLKLLRFAENTAGKSAASGDMPAATRVVQLQFNQASFPDYLGISTHAEKTSCNASLRLAERDGAISIVWDSRAGNFERIQVIRLLDGDILANLLQVIPRWDAASAAAVAFAPHVQSHPVLSSVLEAWRKGASIRSTRPGDEAIRSWLDAIRVVDACRQKAGDGRTDIPIKRLSAALFSDSKRITAIASLIDVLTQGVTTGTPRDEEEFFQEMGLMKFPPTLLMATNPGKDNRVIVQLVDAAVSAVAPYLGFPPHAIVGLDLPTEPMTLLTVENLTTFHEAAEYLQRGAQSAGPFLLMYTGGMPSPSWRQIYRMALALLPKGSTVWHWGDVDAGGFRIANKLAEECDQYGRVLRLHLMDVAPTVSRKSLSDAEVVSIAAICARRNWTVEERLVKDHRSAIEQESLPVTLPSAHR